MTDPLPTQAVLTCTRCGETKPPEDFPRNRRRKTGRDSRCSCCNRAAATRWQRENPERYAARQREYHEANRERAKARARARYEKLDKAEVAAQSREWAARNPEKAKATKRRSYYRAFDADYVEVLLRDGCAYCGAPGTHIDHIEPVRHGGADGWENATPACASCNTRKASKPLLLFLAHRNGCFEWRRDVP